jgi:hypothetical protein
LSASRAKTRPKLSHGIRYRVVLLGLEPLDLRGAGLSATRSQHLRGRRYRVMFRHVLGGYGLQGFIFDPRQLGLPPDFGPNARRASSFRRHFVR